LKQLSYLDDILKEVFRKHKLKYDYKQCLDGVNWMFEYIVQETKNPEVFAINLPYLGHLYKNQNFLINSKKFMEVGSEPYKKVEDQIQQIKRFGDENGWATPHLKLPLFFTFNKYICERFEITETARRMHKPSHQIYAATEYIQNKEYKRLTENK